MLRMAGQDRDMSVKGDVRAEVSNTWLSGHLCTIHPLVNTKVGSPSRNSTFFPFLCQLRTPTLRTKLHRADFFLGLPRK